LDHLESGQEVLDLREGIKVSDGGAHELHDLDGHEAVMEEAKPFDVRVASYLLECGNAIRIGGHPHIVPIDFL
jgi:hypothetical protein